MWLIDEYAIIFRKNVWFSPPIAPTKADNKMDPVISKEDE